MILMRRLPTDVGRTTENGRRAKYYALSPRGRQTLARTTKEWQRQTAAISRVLKASLGEL